jgi:Zn-dependent protease
VTSSKAFSIAGIRIRVDRSWFIAFFLFAWTLSEGYFPLQVPDYPAVAYWVFGTVSSLALFASVLAHELSHSLVALRAGVPVRQITLFIFGGLSEMEPGHSHTPESEFRITLAGPLSSLAIGIVFGVLWFSMRASVDRIFAETLHYLFYVNCLLAFFNLIPGFPLDGGRLLRSYLWLRNGDLDRATRSATRVGRLFAIGLIALGVASLTAFHLITGVWLIMIGLFLKRSAEGTYRKFKMRTSVKDLSVNEVMSPPVAVNAGLALSKFVQDYVFHYHHQVFPVQENNRFLGMIDVGALKRMPPSEWPNTQVADHLLDPSSYSILDPDMSVPEALELLVSRSCERSPVVRSGVLFGVLTRNDLLKLIAIKSEIAA